MEPPGWTTMLTPAYAGANVVFSEVNPVRAALARSLDVGEVLDPTGSPMIRPFLFKKEEVRIHQDWDSFGLIATGQAPL